MLDTGFRRDDGIGEKGTVEPRDLSELLGGPPVIDKIEVKFYFVRNETQTTSNFIEATIVLDARRGAGGTPPVRQNNARQIVGGTVLRSRKSGGPNPLRFGMEFDRSLQGIDRF